MAAGLSASLAPANNRLGVIGSQYQMTTSANDNFDSEHKMEEPELGLTENGDLIKEN